MGKRDNVKNIEKDCSFYFVSQTYMLSGKAHADMEIINYNVAEYRNGKYLEAKDDFNIPQREE